MTTHAPIKLADGTKCYSGPNCRKHGTATRLQQAQQKLNDLFNKLPSKNECEAPVLSGIFAFDNDKQRLIEAEIKPVASIDISWEHEPDYWKESSGSWYREDFADKVEIYRLLGAKGAKVPSMEKAAEYEYVEIPLNIPGDKENTQLITSIDRGSYSRNNIYNKAWLLKNGKPVAMLRYSAYKADYKPTPEEYQFRESMLCDIEVRPGYQGRKLSMEIIKLTEKHILGGRVLFTTGSFTPEGRQALGGKVPFAQEAKSDYTHGPEIARGEIPKASFRSMTFVDDWDNLYTAH